MNVYSLIINVNLYKRIRPIKNQPYLTLFSLGPIGKV